MPVQPTFDGNWEGSAAGWEVCPHPRIPANSSKIPSDPSLIFEGTCEHDSLGCFITRSTSLSHKALSFGGNHNINNFFMKTVKVYFFKRFWHH